MTRLCILQTGDNNPKMKRRVPGYVELFSDMFAPFPQVSLEFVQVHLGEFPEDLGRWDAFLITGSVAGVYDDLDWMDPLRELIRTIAGAGKPLVGICFGHQIIADALGGKAEKSEKGWGLGIRETDLREPPGFATELGPGFKLIYIHQDQVTKAPAGATVFAGDDFCPIAAYHIGGHVLSFQGHPEFRPDVLDAIMEFREEAMGAETTARARATLKDGDDSGAVAAAIVRFIEEAKARDLSSVA